MADQKDRHRLFELLVKTKAFQYSPDKPFELVSGATSPYYFDLKLLAGHPEGIHMVAKVLYDHIRKHPDIKSVGGLESGSISIATAISQQSYLEHNADASSPLIESFFVRKAPKTHGTLKLIEGRITPPVAIIDDVVTSGMSAIKAVAAVQKAGFECGMLMAVIFRGTPENRQKIQQTCKLEYIFDKDEFITQYE